MALALIGGIMGISLAMLRTWDAEKRRQEAVREKQIAESVARFQNDMLAAVDPDQVPRDPVTNEELRDKITLVQAMAAAVKLLDVRNLSDQPLVEARVRDTIGTTLQGLGRFEDAEPNLRQSVALRRKALSASHVDVASSLKNLAGLMQDLSRFAEAEPLQPEALEIRHAALSAGHPDIADSLSSLAELLRIQDKLERGRAAAE